MNRLAVIFLSLLYLTLVSGVVVNVHYCMGKIASVSIGHSESDTCDDCGMENSGCCKDDVKVFKVNDSHAHSLALLKLTKSAATHPSTIQQPSLSISFTNTSEPAAYSRTPLGMSGKSICIRHQVFRI